MLPSIMQYHEEYYVRDSDDITLVANQSAYSIPYRAVGGKFRELFYKDTNGNLISMSRISPEDRPYYQGGGNQNNIVFYYIRGNEVVLVPDVGTSPTGSLMFSYYIRPNILVDVDRTSTITAIVVDVDTTTYTVDNIPENLTTFYQDGVPLTGFSTSSKLDLLQRKPGHRTIGFDIYPTAVDSNNLTITFSNDDLDGSIILGDMIAFAGECNIPQIPTDLHEMLAQRVLQRCMQALGDQAGFTMASSKLSEMEKNTGALIDNRSEGDPVKANNIRGTLRTSKFFRRGWY